MINIYILCQDLSGDMRNLNYTIEVTKISLVDANTTALSDMVTVGKDSTNPEVVLQALRLQLDITSQNQQQTVVDTATQASLLKNSINLLLLGDTNNQ